MNENETWYKNEPEYINWALYEYSGENKYIIEAKTQLESKLDKINLIKYQWSHPIQCTKR